MAEKTPGLLSQNLELGTSGHLFMQSFAGDSDAYLASHSF